MLDLVLTNQFKKDLKRIRKRGYKIQLLDEVLKNLQNEIPLDEKYRDHALVSNWVGHRDCHIKPDLVLIYKKTEEGELLILKLVRLGSHSELAI